MIYMFAKSHGPMVLREKPTITGNDRPLWMRISVKERGDLTFGQALEHSRFSPLPTAVYRVLCYAVFGPIAHTYIPGTNTFRYCQFTSLSHPATVLFLKASVLSPINLYGPHPVPTTTSPTRICTLCMFDERISDFHFRNISDGMIGRERERKS